MSHSPTGRGRCRRRPRPGVRSTSCSSLCSKSPGRYRQDTLSRCQVKPVGGQARWPPRPPLRPTGPPRVRLVRRQAGLGPRSRTTRRYPANMPTSRSGSRAPSRAENQQGPCHHLEPATAGVGADEDGSQRPNRGQLTVARMPWPPRGEVPGQRAARASGRSTLLTVPAVDVERKHFGGSSGSHSRPIPLTLRYQTSQRRHRACGPIQRPTTA